MAAFGYLALPGGHPEINMITQGPQTHRTGLLGKAPLVHSNTKSRDGQTKKVSGQGRRKAVDLSVYHPEGVESPGREFQVV